MALFFDEAVRRPLDACVPYWIKPNHLSLGRVALIVPLLYWWDRPIIAVSAVIVAGALALFDGPPARRRAQGSRRGAGCRACAGGARGAGGSAPRPPARSAPPSSARSCRSSRTSMIWAGHRPESSSPNVSQRCEAFGASFCALSWICGTGTVQCSHASVRDSAAHGRRPGPRSRVNEGWVAHCSFERDVLCRGSEVRRGTDGDETTVQT